MPNHNAFGIEDQFPRLGARVFRVLQELNEKMPRISVHTLGQQFLRVGLTHRLGCIANDLNRSMRQFLPARIKLFEDAGIFRRVAQIWDSLSPYMRQTIDCHRFQITAL